MRLRVSWLDESGNEIDSEFVEYPLLSVCFQRIAARAGRGLYPVEAVGFHCRVARYDDTVTLYGSTKMRAKRGV